MRLLDQGRGASKQFSKMTLLGYGRGGSKQLFSKMILLGPGREGSKQLFSKMILLGPGRRGSKQLFSKMIRLGRGREVSKQRDFVTALGASSRRHSSQYFSSQYFKDFVTGPGLRHSYRPLGTSLLLSSLERCDEVPRAVPKSREPSCDEVPRDAL